jgi:hypothetical protein
MSLSRLTILALALALAQPALAQNSLPTNSISLTLTLSSGYWCYDVERGGSAGDAGDSYWSKTLKDGSCDLGHSPWLITVPRGVAITVLPRTADCEPGWSLVMDANGQPACAWVLKEPLR